MEKIALIGDSIFDNKAYVAPGQAVIDQLAPNEFSASHRDQILKSDYCGCFHCLAIFKPEHIDQWLHVLDKEGDETSETNTALCPKCAIDSVIGAASGYPISKSFLTEMRNYWFGEEVPAVLNDWTPNAVLLAVDGATTEDVADQCKQVTEDITCLVLSIGGNDALAYAGLFQEGALTLYDGLSVLSEIKDQFQKAYQNMLNGIIKSNKPLVICTIYDTCPTIDKPLLAALSAFNDIIFYESFKIGAPVLDLRHIFNSPEDYSSVSPIEPSEIGGRKLAQSIKQVMDSHDFTIKETVIYT